MRKLILGGLFEVAESGRDHDDLVRCARMHQHQTIAFLGMGALCALVLGCLFSVAIRVSNSRAQNKVYLYETTKILIAHVGKEARG